MPLGVQLTTQELTNAISSLANGKAVGLDGVSIKLLKMILKSDPALRRRLLVIVDRFWRGGEVPPQRNYAIIMVLQNKERSDRVWQLQGILSCKDLYVKD